MSKLEDYNVLSARGNIGFYEGCEVTQVFLHRKKDKVNFNFYTIVVFEETAFIGQNHHFLCDLITVNSEYSLGVQSYHLTLDESLIVFETLQNENKWDYNGNKTLIFPNLKLLTKQYIPSTDGNRINNVLKNNFHSGSYIIEFFDEVKRDVQILLKIEALEKLNSISESIKKLIPLDLSVVRDRIGNFIFQFPITILETSPKALKTWDGVKIKFAWHSSLLSLPDCFLQVEASLDKNYTGNKIVEYNKTNEQSVIIGSLDEINQIKIWRKEPSLILSLYSGSYMRDLDFTFGLTSPEPRLFEINGILQEVDITSNQRNGKKKPIDYTRYINNSIYEVEKKQLEKSLSFKQYKNLNEDSIHDIRRLISENGNHGVYVWDPFLTANDILNTLFFSRCVGVDLRAIGSFNRRVRDIYKSDPSESKGVKLINCIKDILNIKDKKNIKAPWKAYMENNKTVLDSPNHNNNGLQLEFRLQHSNFGWEFHDRFLIFPPFELKRAKVYSLGTSINSYGKSHHILMEVSHPQPVVDAFNELWSQLDRPECLVWKFPRK